MAFCYRPFALDLGFPNDGAFGTNIKSIFAKEVSRQISKMAS
jgi:hypothetical protein